MNKFVTTIAITIALQTAIAQSVYKYQVEKINNDIYVLHPLISDYRWVTANIIVIINETDVLVVDSGLLPDAAFEAIKEIRKLTPKPVRYLVNTHWHGDHWQGNEAFAKTYPGLQIIATEQGKLSMEENGMVWVKTLYLKHHNNYVNIYEKAVAEKSLDGEALTDPKLSELKTAVVDMKKDIESLKKLNPVLPNTTYSDKLVITDKKREIQLLYYGVANTSGDAIVYLPGEKILITGDLVVHPAPYESGMFSPEWLEVMRKMNTLDYQVLLPGHGEVQHDKAYVNFLIAYFAEIISQIRTAYVTSGISSPEELRKVVTDKTVGDKLVAQDPAYQKFVDQVGTGFVSAAIGTASKRVIQGKK